jgi:hypothetical protein
MQPSTSWWSVALAAALLLAVLTLQPARINAAATHHQGIVLTTLKIHFKYLSLFLTLLNVTLNKQFVIFA